MHEDMNLEIKDVTVKDGTRIILNEVSLVVKPGEITALLGPNGAGKTELVKTVGGVLPISSGSVYLGDKNLNNMRPEHIRRAGIAAVPEGHHVLTELNVLENLQAAASMHKGKVIDNALMEAFDTFPELVDLKERKAGLLSGGQQQMVVLAQAIISKPKFILADEMSLGLAPIVVNRLIETLSALSNQGTGILLIEQFTNIALKVANQVHVMGRGEISFSGTAKELNDNPKILHEAYL